MDKKVSKALQEYLDSRSHDEISWILSRYCGPHNECLFDREFSRFGLSRVDFEKEVKNRLFTSLLEDVMSNL